MPIISGNAPPLAQRLQSVARDSRKRLNGLRASPVQYETPRQQSPTDVTVVRIIEVFHCGVRLGLSRSAARFDASVGQAIRSTHNPFLAQSSR